MDQYNLSDLLDHQLDLLDLVYQLDPHLLLGLLDHQEDPPVLLNLFQMDLLDLQYLSDPLVLLMVLLPLLIHVDLSILESHGLL
jgi:hypothetical protein